ncbi:MAG: Repressor in ring oxydation complex/ phenylacetic acid degradation pathway related protein (PaaX) [Parcubacteria group bacterium GW2011_GWA1_33_6]|nr:MAG: Repressor in ring oxydation complex/ phenylacetic acid degradation pathway related protein (PaaX) [Parcubacteria group bacterium GW2011_GWA2_33_14]KKP55103.1 MAG: Repressor in ring oxydation complex/ phenylacetic acid degradation pathway related protein (PaaX) [Parcubacteria group bacterium GW2011_GWA1_33_6]
MHNTLKKKILLLLLGGLALGFSHNPNKYRKVLKVIGESWQEINKYKLKKEIRNIYRSKLVKEKINTDGSLTLVLSDKGKLKALTYHFSEIKIQEKMWDKKWRMVFFDIPEKYRWGRDSLRKKLKELKFQEIQKSVFTFPYECEDEINFIIEYYGIRKYVRYATLDYIDDDLHLRDYFKLN